MCMRIYSMSFVFVINYCGPPIIMHIFSKWPGGKTDTGKKEGIWFGTLSIDLK